MIDRPQRWSATTIPANRQSKDGPFIDSLPPGVGLSQKPPDQRHDVVLVIEFGRFRDLTVVEPFDELALSVVDEDRRGISQRDFGVKSSLGSLEDVQQVDSEWSKILNPFAKCLRRLVFRAGIVGVEPDAGDLLRKPRLQLHQVRKLAEVWSNKWTRRRAPRLSPRIVRGVFASGPSLELPGPASKWVG